MRLPKVVAVSLVVLSLASGCGGGGASIAPPTAPGSVVATADVRSAHVTWTAPASDGGSPIAQYTVTASPGGATATTSALSATITGLLDGTAYTFIVTATNAAGAGTPSTASAPVTTPDVPSAPTSISATAGVRSATVAWTAPATTGGAALTGYTVSIAPAVPAAVFTVSGTSATVTGLANGATYTFTVLASNAVGDGPASAASAAISTPDVPGAPTDVTAVPSDGSASLTWSPPASTGGLQLSGYTVVLSPEAPSAVFSVSGTTAAISGLANGTSYVFRVYATNGAGDGPQSAPSAAAVPLTVPGAPTGVSAIAGNAQATVNWTAPASNGGSPITLYTVTASPGGATALTTGTSTAVSGLANGTSYTFTVAAANAAGTGPASGPSAAVTPVTVPGAPTNVVATAGVGSASVSWTEPASNGGNALTGYTVLVSPSAPSAIFVVTGTTAAVSGLANGTTYTFQVTATSGVGTSAASAPSAPVSTPSAPGAPTGLAAVAGNASATLTWTAPASDGGSAITSYGVDVSPAKPDVVTTMTGPTSASVSGLTNGALYSFTVTASNAVGAGPASAAATATPVLPVPDPPTGVTATVASGQATVSWTASGLATSYDVYWSTSPGVSKASGTKVTGAVSGAALAGLAGGTTYHVVVTAVNASGESAESTPASFTTTFPWLVGTFAYSGAGGTDMAVDGPRKRVYVSGGMAQSGLVRIDASDLAAMTQTNLAYGAGVAADGATGRYATTSGYGSIYVYDADDKLYDAQPISGCGGALAADAVTNRFFVSSQCSDHVLVYSEASKSVLANIADSGTGSSVVFDPKTLTVFQNLTPNRAWGAPAPLAVTASYAASSPFAGFVVAADGALGRLYVATNGGTTLVLDSSTYATLHTFGTAYWHGAADTALARLYVPSGAGNTILAYDGNTYAQVSSVTLPTAVQNLAMAPGDSRLYAIDGSRLYVLQTGTAATSAPAAPTGVTATVANAQATVSWTGSSGATSYNLYWSTSPNVSKAVGTKVAGAASGAAVPGLAPGTTYYAVVTAVNAAGESAESSPAASFTTTLPWIVGTFTYSGAGGTGLAVDGSTQRVYVSGGMGQQGLVRIDASNPAAMTQTTLPYGGGVAADSSTGRYATTSGYGGVLYVFDPDDTLYDSETISGCGGELAADPVTNRFFVSSQCSDHLAVYGEASKTLVANLADTGTGSSVVFDPTTLTAYQNLTPNPAWGAPGPLAVGASYATSSPFAGFVVAADGTLGRLYVATNGGTTLVLDSVTLATRHAFGAAYWHAATDTALGRVYVPSGNAILAYDENSYAQVATIAVPAAIQNLAMAAGDSRLYAIDGSRLYVIQTR